MHIGHQHGIKSAIMGTKQPSHCCELDEERSQSCETVLQEPDKRSFHFCIVNLVIGTLYCVKGNYEFGIARIIKSLEPASEKLESDTWFYTKRCLLALFEGITKHMIVLKASRAQVWHSGWQV